MIRGARVRAIAFFELRATITRPAFIATTFLLPIVLFGLSFGSIALQGALLAQRLLGRQTFGVVDETAALTRTVSDDEITLEPYASRDAGLAALENGDVQGVVIVPRDWLSTGRVEIYTDIERSPFDPPPSAPPLLVRTLLSKLLEGDVTDAVRARVLDPAREEAFVISRQGIQTESDAQVTASVTRTVVPIMFGILFLTALLTASGYLVQAVAADKETRTAEVLLACVTPEEVLFGKLVGLGTAGLVQLAVWVSFSAFGAGALGRGLDLTGGVVPIAAVLLAPVLFVAGYFFLGSVMLVTGALGTNAAEAQKVSVVWALLGVMPTFLLVSFMDTPHGTIPRMLSLFPPSAPLALMLRLGMNPSGVAWWEVPVVLLELALCTFVVLRVGARLFAYGLLSTALPSLRELLAVLRGPR